MAIGLGDGFEGDDVVEEGVSNEAAGVDFGGAHLVEGFAVFGAYQVLGCGTEELGLVVAGDISERADGIIEVRVMQAEYRCNNSNRFKKALSQ